MHNHTAVKVSTLPDCDFCMTEGIRVTAVYNGKTVFGPWAFMCQKHFDAYGHGVGLGVGQKLITEGVPATS